MHENLKVRRRVLELTYRRYMAADRALVLAVRDTRQWFPTNSNPSLRPLGNPGSPIRKLHDQRDRALRQLEVARLKLGLAKKRIEQRRREKKPVEVLMVSYSDA